MKTDTSRDAALLRRSQELKISTMELTNKIDNFSAPQVNMAEENVRDLYSHVKKNKEVLDELGKWLISFEDMLGKNLNNFHNTLKQNCETLEEQV